MTCNINRCFSPDHTVAEIVPYAQGEQETARILERLTTVNHDQNSNNEGNKGIRRTSNTDSNSYFVDIPSVSLSKVGVISRREKEARSRSGGLIQGWCPTSGTSWPSVDLEGLHIQEGVFKPADYAEEEEELQDADHESIISDHLTVFAES
ncbi:uncharacterized protein LOC111248134 [Varroa destructor]|uniref:Uncharacterized protein n=1 Tax=Varroa destructor TaxID=109461 RepID=A0A7M7JU26_VARDE|nr:uncharacterized protein LOC111248134 [Varroa destructor]